MPQPRGVYPGQTVELMRRALRCTVRRRTHEQLNRRFLYRVTPFAERHGASSTSGTGV